MRMTFQCENVTTKTVINIRFSFLQTVSVQIKLLTWETGKSISILDKKSLKILIFQFRMLDTMFNLALVNFKIVNKLVTPEYHIPHI